MCIRDRCVALAVTAWQNWSVLRDGALLTYSAVAETLTRAVGFPGAFTPQISRSAESARFAVFFFLSLFTALESWALGLSLIHI